MPRRRSGHGTPHPRVLRGHPHETLGCNETLGRDGLSQARNTRGLDSRSNVRHHDDGRSLGRVARRRRRGAAGRRGDPGSHRAPGRRGAAGPPGCGGGRHPHDGDHVHRLLRRLEHRPGVAVRRHPAGHRGRRVGGDRAWPRAAAQGAQQFIDDVYNDRRVIADGVFPAELLDDSVNYRPECQGVHPKFGVWAHISGSDLVRDADGTMYVLEDNLRVPSGVSYVIENRAVAKRAFPELFARQSIAPVDGYTDELNKLLVVAGARRRRRSVDRRADAGHLQLGLLRALVPRPADGCRRSSRAATSSSATTIACTCARSTGSSRSTSSTAASTTCSSIRRCSAPTRRSACRA